MRYEMTRRGFLASAAAAPLLCAADTKRVRIRDVQTMAFLGGRTYTLVKVVADDGQFGIGEAYGTPGACSPCSSNRPPAFVTSLMAASRSVRIRSNPK